MNVPNSVFISTVLAIFSRTREIPASSIGELQVIGVVRELFHTLGATDSMGSEYVNKVLRRLPPGVHPALSGSLQAFLDNKVSPGLLHKYEISPDDLVNSWTFDALEDPSTLESFNIGASVECEHHARWAKRKDTEKPWNPTRGPGTKFADDEPTTATLDEVTETKEPGEKSSEIDSLMEL